MEEKFIIVWTVDGETMNLPHSTQAEALHQAEKLFREHGCDLEVTLQGGTSRPSALAVLRLAIVMNLFACSTGMSRGLVPFSILSTKTAARRNCSEKSTP